MRLALTDVKKSITRHAGQRYVVPFLLRPSERTRELAALIELYESWLGRPRAGFPLDRPAELIGDYRLARCLEACLGEWYAWQSSAWPGSVAPAVADALAGQGIASPSALRLALYDCVNREYGGYLAAQWHEAALAAFAASLELDRAALNELLYLDANERTVLAHAAPEAPTARALAARYNQRAFEAVLAAAARIELVIAAQPAAGDDDGDGLGTIVKRICFLARRMGVQYDVTFDAPPDARLETPAPLAMVAERPAAYRTGFEDVAEPLDAAASRGPLVVTLYGPQELTGAPAQYGDRLARLIRALLGYRRGSRDGRAALSGAEVSGTATVYLHGRPLLFALDDRLLKLIGAADADDGAAGSGFAGMAGPEFDSDLERALYVEFAALEAAGEAHGWRLEREPEPIVAGETILVPDFALTRGPRRVYLEIAGYWRPEYRERKARKLLAVRDRVALAVAAPESAKGELAGAAETIPVLWYRNRVSAQGLLGLLERAYDDRERRLASLDAARVLAELAHRGRIPPAEAYTALRCYTRNELAEALERLRAAAEASGAGAPEWVEGVGLCGAAWMATALDTLRDLLGAADGGRVPLEQARTRLADVLKIDTIPEAAVETLARLAGLAIVRDSIFEAYLAREAAAQSSESAGNGHAPEKKTQPRGRSRRKHSDVTQSIQQSMPLLFAPEQTGSDDTEPDTPTRATDTTSKEARRGR